MRIRNIPRVYSGASKKAPWRSESVASEMVMNVTAALLSQDSTNAEQLSGEAITRNIHLASRYPPGAMVGALLPTSTV